MSEKPKHPLFDAYVEACNYPGKLDESAVESSLQQYLSALGVKRDVVRLKQGWTLEEHAPLDRTINEILDDFQKRTGYKPNSKKSSRAALDARAARDARDALAALVARDAQDARDARDALVARDAQDARDAAPLRFAKWCIQGRGWWWYNWEISWIATMEFGAVQRNDTKVSAWSNPLLGAFLNGCWLLFWTSDTLYWVSKPTVHTEQTNGSRRLHNDSYAALESDVENLYFMHGVLVPAFVVVRPDWITIKHIRDEQNAEVRRVMIERMGWDKFCSEAKMNVLHEDKLESNFPSIPMSEMVSEGARLVTSYRPGVEIAQLLEADRIVDFEDRPLRFVRLTDPSTGRQYTLRVLHSHTRCYEAVGWTFGKTEEQYKNGRFIRHGDVFLDPLSGGPTAQSHS